LRDPASVCTPSSPPLVSPASTQPPPTSATPQYNSGTGWPSFYQALDGAVRETDDNSIFFSPRTEVRCSRCEGHLGHVFNDGPSPTFRRYCMNGLALGFVPAA